MIYAVQKIYWLSPGINAQTKRRVEGLGYAYALPIEVVIEETSPLPQNIEQCALVVDTSLSNTPYATAGWAQVIHLSYEPPPTSNSDHNTIYLPMNSEPSKIFPKVAKELLAITRTIPGSDSWQTISLTVEGDCHTIHELVQSWSVTHKLNFYALIQEFLSFAKIVAQQSPLTHATATIFFDGITLNAILCLRGESITDAAFTSILAPSTHISVTHIKTSDRALELSLKTHLWKSEDYIIISITKALADAIADIRRAS